MRGTEMLDAVGYVDADLIEKAEKVGEKKAVRQAILRYGAIAASFALVMGGVFLAGKYLSNDPPIISGEVSETTEPDESGSEVSETKEPDESSGETVETGRVNTFYEDGTFTVTEVLVNGCADNLRQEEILSAPEICFVYEEVYTNPYPIYINQYGSGMGGPIFEVTDEVVDFMTGGLQDYLYILYGENVSADEITVPEYMSDRSRVEYSRGNISFLAGPEVISVRFPYDELSGEVPHDVTIESLQCVGQIKAAMEYLGIRNPQMKLTVMNNLKNEPYEYCYQIFEEANSKNEYLVNCAFACIRLIYMPGLDTVLLQMNKVETPEVCTYPTLVSMSSAEEYIRQKYPNAAVDKAKVEVFYSTTVVPGYYIPCYRFHVAQYSERHSEILGYIIEIPMISQEDIAELMAGVHFPWME